jgi:hypothetical protein
MKVHKMPVLTSSRLKELLSYDAETGMFVWMMKRPGRGRQGAVAGCKNMSGYWGIHIEGFEYKAHRLAWLYVHGEWPSGQIDHIDGNRINNAIGNLRDVSKHLNMQNQRKPQKSNTSGYLGVSWQKSRNRWEARITAFGKQHFLGTFDSAESAYESYVKAKMTLHASCTLCA